MPDAADLIRDYFARTGQPRDDELDAAFMYQRTVLKELLERLDAILTDEGIDPGTRQRVIRSMLYGSPSEADARLRMEQHERMADLLNRGTGTVVHVSGPSGPGHEAISQILAGLNRRAQRNPGSLRT